MTYQRILILFVLTFSLYSCVNTIDGDGNVVTEERNVNTFNKIDISGHFEVFIKQGKQENVEIETDQNLLQLIETETKKEVL